MSKIIVDHNNNCTNCHGFGMWPGETVPLTADEALDGLDAEECPMCGKDNATFEYICDKKENDELLENFIFILNEKIDKALYEFEKGLRCVELLDIQESNLDHLQW